MLCSTNGRVSLFLLSTVEWTLLGQTPSLILHIPGPSTVPAQSECSITTCWMNLILHGKRVLGDRWNWLLRTGLEKLPFCCISFWYLSFYMREMNREFSPDHLNLWIMWWFEKEFFTEISSFQSKKTTHRIKPQASQWFTDHTLHILKFDTFYVISCTFVMLGYLTHSVS